MGINYSLLSKQHSHLVSEYELLESFDILLYGTFNFINHLPTDRKLLYKEFNIEKSSTNLTPEIFFSRLTNPLPSLLTFEKGNILDSESNYVGFILFEAFDFEANLANEIQARKNLHYSEENLWKILENTLSCLDYMISLGKSALCITPHHIYLQNDTYKLMDFEDFTDLLNNLDLTDAPVLFYQSPHLITALKDQEPIEINEKDNIFSLGISLIEAALLEHPLNIDEEEFNFDLLEESKSRLYEYYSVEIVEILKGMVHLDEDSRFDLKSLMNEIRRVDRLVETPKSFKQKDELFGLGKSKINTGISLQISHDFQFSSQNPLLIPPKPLKNMILEGGIMEENSNKSFQNEEDKRQNKGKEEKYPGNEIYYLSSEILPKSELFNSIESNNLPAKTFADYRVSLQSKIEERPSEQFFEERISSFKPPDRTSEKSRHSENVKKGGFPSDVNTMSPVNTANRASMNNNNAHFDDNFNENKIHLEQEFKKEPDYNYLKNDNFNENKIYLEQEFKKEPDYNYLKNSREKIDNQNFEYKSPDKIFGYLSKSDVYGTGDKIQDSNEKTYKESHFSEYYESAEKHPFYDGKENTHLSNYSSVETKEQKNKNGEDYYRSYDYSKSSDQKPLQNLTDYSASPNYLTNNTLDNKIFIVTESSQSQKISNLNPKEDIHPHDSSVYYQNLDKNQFDHTIPQKPSDSSYSFNNQDRDNQTSHFQEGDAILKQKTFDNNMNNYDSYYVSDEYKYQQKETKPSENFYSFNDKGLSYDQKTYETKETKYIQNNPIMTNSYYEKAFDTKDIITVQVNSIHNQKPIEETTTYNYYPVDKTQYELKETNAYSAISQNPFENTYNKEKETNVYSGISQNPFKNTYKEHNETNVNSSIIQPVGDIYSSDYQNNKISKDNNNQRKYEENHHLSDYYQPVDKYPYDHNSTISGRPLSFSVSQPPFENFQYPTPEKVRNEKKRFENNNDQNYFSSSFNQKPFEESRYIEKTPEKISYEYEKRSHIPASSFLKTNAASKIVYSSEKNAWKFKLFDEEYQRKSFQIQEKKKALDRSLNILRDACNFLKEIRKPLI